MPVAAGVSATFTTSDSPGTVLDPTWLSLNLSDSFDDFFVYKLNDMPGTPTTPPSPGPGVTPGHENIWVPIGHAHWSWSGTAVQATPTATPNVNPTWSLAAAPTPRVSATFDLDKGALPTWNDGFLIGTVACAPWR